MKKFLFLGAASLALAACSSGGDADKDGDGKVSAEEAKAEMASGGAMDMQAGEYEVTISFSEIDAPGIPESARKLVLDQMGKGTTIKTCLTQEQVSNPGADFFGGEDSENCSMDKLDRSGNKMTVAMTCDIQGGIKASANMDGTFGKDNYVMDMEQTMTGAPTGDMTMKGRIEGKRIGDCA